MDFKNENSDCQGSSVSAEEKDDKLNRMYKQQHAVGSVEYLFDRFLEKKLEEIHQSANTAEHSKPVKNHAEQESIPPSTRNIQDVEQVNLAKKLQDALYTIKKLEQEELSDKEKESRTEEILSNACEYYKRHKQSLPLDIIFCNIISNSTIKK